MRATLLAIALAGTPAAASAGDLTPKAAAEVLDQVSHGLDTYIDPAAAKAAQRSLRAHRGDYLKLDSREAFAAAVSGDLYAATHDKHLKMSVQTLAADRGATVNDAQQALIDRHIAYGLMAIRRLPGNVGYLKLSYFEQGEAGVRLVDAAMGLLKDTDALIIDLRQNRGGGGASDAELLGHLSATPIPMAEITWRNADGTTTVTRRAPAAPAGGPLYADKPLFVLTSARTFSAAEAFAYDLKAAGRAVIVGETTEGGANPSNRDVPLSYGFRIFIPNGHVVHPTTHANWEGVGVAPDVATAADGALTVAYARALVAARPKVATPKSERERAAAIADPQGVLQADQAL